MKYIIRLSLILFSVVFTVHGMAQDEEKSGPKIKFEEQQHDFGDVKQGEKVSHTFTFTNS
ncbi:MAG: DUF1573 domain-containing protein, partial [Cyclobacteriaceae bacterium]